MRSDAVIGLSFRFPAGRYHATPWGRHVNEADVAWPPEPWRILRALIACYHRKADRDRFSETDLAGLIDALAEAAPVYRLPDAVHAHARHFMPAPVTKTLVFDAFARFDASEPILVCWPEAALDGRSRALLDHLAERLGYLGRAESWVEAETFEAWPDGPGPNCIPQDYRGASDLDATTAVPVRLRAPLPAVAYAAARERHLARIEGPRRQAEKVRKTLPERLVDALALDTADLQAARWSAPPASQELLYTRPPLGPVPRSRAVRPPARRDLPDTARYILAGRPRPRIEDAVKIGELARVAALSRIGYAVGRDRIPPTFSGRGAGGKPLNGGAHTHAFYLPEDADGDGEIDHLVIHVPAGIDADCQRALDRLVRLWLEPRGRADADDGSAERGRQEWRLALEGFGRREAFADASRLLDRACRWVSATPYLMPWHSKTNLNPRSFRMENVEKELRPAVEADAITRGEALRLSEAMRQIRRECEKRLKIRPERIDPCLEGCGSVTGLADAGDRLLPAIMVNGRPRRAAHFHRFRSRRGLTQPDTQGSFWRLTFAEPVSGPLALGFGCHFGLGLFRSER